jgi:hypothetical protein
MRMDHRSKNGKTIIQNELQYNIKSIKTINSDPFMISIVYYITLSDYPYEKYSNSLNNRH